MSAAERVRELSALPLAVLSSVVGWLLLAPLALLVPKRKEWVAVIGRQDGRFLDNAKYFFLQAPQHAESLRLVFITERADVVTLLTRHGREAIRYPTYAAAWFLLRCGIAVVDEASWHRRLRVYLLGRARIVQLWHGVGCKWVELKLWEHQTGRVAWFSHPLVLRLRLLAYQLTGRRMRYAAVATTSRFYRDEVFKPAFLARQFPITGYPRNDFGQSLIPQARALAWANVDPSVAARLRSWQQAGKRMVLVAPTFRDSGSMPMQLDATTLDAIDAYADAHGVEFVFKFHPSERNAGRISGRHFHVCARDSDIYPFLPHAAALVTDYSSISMDFLLVDRPLLFLIPEGDDYIRRDRQLQFDPRTMMPGPVVPDWPALLEALKAEWTHDGFRSERDALRQKAFENLPQAEAVPKLLALMRQQGWIGGQSGQAIR